MVRIRPYKPLDAKDMTEWINNEKILKSGV